MRTIIIFIFLCASTVGAFAQKKANNSHKKQAKNTLSIMDNCMIHLDSVVSEEAKKAIFEFDEMMSMVSPTMACLQKYITKKWDLEAQCPNCTSLKEYLVQHKYNETGQMAEDIAVAYWVHLKFPKMSGSIETYISKKSKFLPPGVNHGDLNCDFIKQ